ncbi:23S rRNA (uracil(1939)-C(5))-methyltransferase RlmD [uncultured Faecalibaculum sp.]|uniref:23S rRNA (uracil(1939)-C(5))-methyltransferase RlmD n=2 Tax=uncultured Faecalibaculum sp. TaxID=1729681 RepID=UPI0026111C00|nr:23S rRNA (uracil(1939)-C(5))-methyltransferase RlmD [uncultured Faecalibaculum sp.]
MKRNEEFTGECLDLSDQGYGVLRHDGEVVFVPGLLPQEKARIRVILAKKSFAIGKVLERLTDSPQRVKAPCPVFGKCGGCALQDLNYEQQLAWKTDWMKRKFAGIEVRDILGMRDPYRYRNKAQFPVQVTEQGQVITGFYRPNSHTIVDTDTCLIQDERLNELYQYIRKALTPETAAGLRHIFLRRSRKTGQSQVVLIGEENHFRELTSQLVRRFPELVSVVFNHNSRNDNVILGEEYDVLHGSDSIEEDSLGIRIRLHFKSFFQVNPEMMEVLYKTALEAADIQPGDRVIDMYSGTGTLGLLAARQGASVTGVEIVPEAVDNARHNARLNGIDNADFRCQDASAFAKENQEPADVLIVDPPRKGLSEQGIRDIVRISPKRIVYVSCGPNTLKRDLERFAQGGWQARWIQPVDMFCQTPNVEAVCLLEKE